MNKPTVIDNPTDKSPDEVNRLIEMYQEANRRIRREHKSRTADDLPNRKCSVPWCKNHVIGYTLFCATHRLRNSLHGHPLARPMRGGEFSRVRKPIRGYLLRNPNPEPGSPLDTMLRFTTGWLNIGAGPPTTPPTPGHDTLRLLNKAGVTPHDMVTAIIGQYITNRDQPGRFPEGDMALRAIGYAIRRSLTRYTALSPSEQTCIASRCRGDTLVMGTTVDRFLGEHAAELADHVTANRDHFIEATKPPRGPYLAPRSHQRQVARLVPATAEAFFKAATVETSNAK